MERLLIPYVVIGAAVLSVAQAWAAAGTPVQSRYAVAWGVSTAAFLAPIVFAFGLPGGVDAGRNQVAWTAIVLPVITAAALAMASWVRSPSGSARARGHRLHLHGAPPIPTAGPHAPRRDSVRCHRPHYTTGRRAKPAGCRSPACVRSHSSSPARRKDQTT
jgi:hypothetical protein